MIDISLYFHYGVFWIISDFMIHLMHFTSELQTPITFLFMNENVKCGHAFFSKNVTNILVHVLKVFGFVKIYSFAYSAHPFSVGGTLHVAYKKYKIKRKFNFYQ